jgi:hypothetical protein
VDLITEHDLSNVQCANAAASIRRSLDPGSKDKLESEVQRQEAEPEIVSTDAGMETGRGDEHSKKAFPSIR